MSVTECKVQFRRLPFWLPKVGKAKNWPTPLEDDASNVNPSDKRMKTLVSSTKGSGMKLNPNWVEQLMGLPAGWTQLPAHWLTG